MAAPRKSIPWSRRDPGDIARVICGYCDRKTTIEADQLHLDCERHGSMGGNDTVWVCPACLRRGRIYAEKGVER